MHQTSSGPSLRFSISRLYGKDISAFGRKLRAALRYAARPDHCKPRSPQLPVGFYQTVVVLDCVGGIEATVPGHTYGTIMYV